MADEVKEPAAAEQPKGGPKASSKTSSKKKGKKKTGKKKNGTPATTGRAAASAYPRHALRKALRIPRAILDQNAGKPCTDAEAAGFCGIKYSGEFGVEISSANKYGFLRRPSAGQVEVTELAKKVLRPKQPGDEIDGLREALLNAPVISDVYKHYRGENIPDDQSVLP